MSKGRRTKRETAETRSGAAKEQPKLATTQHALPEHKRWAEEGRSQRMP